MLLNFKSFLILLVAFSFCIDLSAKEKCSRIPTYLDDNQPIETRVDDALNRMTLEEKIAMVHAQSKFSSPGVPRLGIPEVWCTDGPHGIRVEVLWDEWNQANWTNDSCTAFPALTCLAATWEPELSNVYGKSIGEEARYRNKSILLGPGVNIYRTPLNGRNFEYMGEDPFLASKMVVPYIKGVQDNGVAACIKHFALNNNEVNRNTSNVIVDDRALYEIYLPAFKAAVIEGNVWSVMGAYNLYKNQQASHNKYLLNDILKGEWNFDGVVLSDWGAVHNTKEAVYNGLDLEFGTGTDGLKADGLNSYDNYFLANPYLRCIKNGEMGLAELNDKVRRILRLIFRTSMNRNRPYGSFASPEHFKVARTIGERGIVLLKNHKEILPIDEERVKKIAVVGENAVKMMTVGGGSSSLKTKYEVSPLEGLRKRLPNVDISFSRGYVGSSSKEYNGVVTGQNLNDKRSSKELLAEAVANARGADYVIFFGGLNKDEGQDCEGVDRKSLSLPYGQNELIDEILKVNKNIIVVNISGNAVSMPWVNDVPAILQAWYLGSEAGNSIASVLLGDVNPSGKLPFTFPEKLTDCGSHKLGEYPGTNRLNSSIVDIKYNEGIFVGYRWFEKENIKPLFPFGHGLSYTKFKYGNLEFSSKELSVNDSLVITVPVTNIGSRSGSEVVQLYIGDKKSSLPRPIKELKGFCKVDLQVGETKNVRFVISANELSFFDDKKHLWTAEPGEFIAFVAASSCDVKSQASFFLKE